MFAKLILAAVTLTGFLVRADPNPIVPGPGDSYKEGGDCIIQWQPDTTGKWTNMNIALKTGDNYNMVLLEAITTIDGTKQSQYKYPCPSVTPNSAIYFYEFSTSSSPEKYWTTRFTITDKDGNSTPPANTTQPNGDKIPWGTGNLLDGDNNASSLPSSGSSSLSYGPSSGLPASSSRMSSSSSSRSSSTGSPTPSQTGSTQSNANGSIVLAVPGAAAFMAGLVATFTAFL